MKCKALGLLEFLFLLFWSRGLPKKENDEAGAFNATHKVKQFISFGDPIV